MTRRLCLEYWGLTHPKKRQTAAADRTLVSDAFFLEPAPWSRPLIPVVCTPTSDQTWSYNEIAHGTVCAFDLYIYIYKGLLARNRFCVCVVLHAHVSSLCSVARMLTLLTRHLVVAKIRALVDRLCVCQSSRWHILSALLIQLSFSHLAQLHIKPAAHAIPKTHPHHHPLSVLL